VCGSYLDLEDVMFDNYCFVCGASQGYDMDLFELNCSGGVK
jgi:hypothetical protein